MPSEVLATRSGRVLNAAIVLGSLALTGVVWWYYTRQRDAIEDEVAERVAAVADAKVTHIADWRQERLGEGRVLEASGIVYVARRIFSGAARPSDPGDLVAVMRQMEEEFRYTGAFLVDQNGGIRLQFPADHPAPSRLADFARAGAVADEAKLEDLYLDDHLKRPLMAVNIPVRGLGALILEIDPERFLYPYLRSWPGPSATAETALARLNGDGTYVYLNDLRQRKGTALTYRRSLTGLPPISAFEAGWQNKGTDYHGAAVIGTVRRVPDSPWYLIAKIDVAEADAPARRLGWAMALIIALIGIAAATLAGLVWRSRELRIYHEREAWFRAVANDTPANLWMRRAEWTVATENETSFINAPLRRFLGLGPGPLSGSWVDRVHPDDAERAKSTFLEALAARRAYVSEYRIRRFDEQYRWVVSQGLPRFSASGEFLGYAGSITDIHDRREAEQELRKTNTTLAEELAQRTRHEQQIQSLSARLIDAQEDERKRVARELHDDLCQQIAALSLAMGNLKRHIPTEQTEARSASDRIQQKLAQAADSVRQISHQLHPAVLEYSGLAGALRAYCGEFTALTGIRVALHAEGSFERVPAYVALSLYRIAQEALQNVAKHARADEATVRLGRAGGELCLSIEDRGVGMELGTNRGEGLGLVSIRERTRLIHGTVEISSHPNQGTAVRVTVPQEAADAQPPLAAAAGPRLSPGE